MTKIWRGIRLYFKNIDLYLLLVPILAVVLGCVVIYSATYSEGSMRYVIVQLAAMVIGVAGFVVMSLIDVEEVSPAWKIVYVINLLLQCSLLVFGVDGGTGNRSWIRFAGIGIQPAEIGKILFIFTFSKHVSLLQEKLNHWRSLAQLAAHLAVLLAVIVLISKDMGMSLAYVFIAVVILFIGGLSWKWLALGAGLCVAAVPVIWNFVLGRFQKLRIMVLFDPSLDPAIAYQTEQSKIAIGSGQLIGEGYLQGRQTQYGMLPAKHTDFIFSVVGEEFGMFGCLVVIAILSFIILRLFYVSYKASSSCSTLICAGIGGMILFQTVLNILMCLGVMPVIGLTLPFFSYGGSSVATMFVAMGIVAGIRMREKPSWLQ